jgi:hypothetical protein
MIRRSKVRAGTTTDAVLQILNVPRHFQWLTMRDIIAIGTDRGLDLSLNEVASTLANLEPSPQTARRQPTWLELSCGRERRVVRRFTLDAQDLNPTDV